MDILKEAKAVNEKVTGWYKELHQIPEVGTDLPKTAQYICDKLDEMGIEYVKGVGLDSAIVGTIKGQDGGKTLALRADMDALNVVEDTGLPFAATDGKMHACGHDGHISVLLGAADILSKNKDKFKGTVKLLFQPAEEISGGAQPMIAAGALDGVDFIIGIHSGNLTSQEGPGNILFSDGPIMACMDKFVMDVIGYGAHGAMPHTGKDPVVMAAETIIACQKIISREMNPTFPGVVSFDIVDGGTAFNVIPQKVHIEGTARAVTPETREFIATRIGEIAQKVAEAYRGSVEYEYIYQAPPLVNDAEFTLKVMEATKKVLGEDVIHMLEKPSMGGEDFAYYLEKIPGTFIFLNNSKAVGGEIYAHHNPKFCLDSDMFYMGVATFVSATLEILQ